ncbi:MAG TPA: two-component system response regulator [Elusimicrobia bacterium]|nr:two-component system response regulator [Elusimicrobiota bacterium]HBT61410.1 two-component system response regulator [Elusimicrobiota bacterium]
MPLRLLVVDDSPVSRILITEMVREGGHEVVAEAEDMAQTLEAYRNQKPDLVTLDLSLAKEDGRAILKALLENDPKAKVLVISGNTQERVIADLITAGAAGFVAKPFDQDDLLRALTRFSPA